MEEIFTTSSCPLTCCSNKLHQTIKDNAATPNLWCLFTSNQILAPKYQFKCIMVFLWPSFAPSRNKCTPKALHLLLSSWLPLTTPSVLCVAWVGKRRPKGDHDAFKLILWSQNLVASVTISNGIAVSGVAANFFGPHSINFHLGSVHYFVRLLKFEHIWPIHPSSNSNIASNKCACLSVQLFIQKIYLCTCLPNDILSLIFSWKE